MNAISTMGKSIGQLSGFHVRDNTGKVLYSVTDHRDGDVFEFVPAENTASGKRGVWIGIGTLEDGIAATDEGQVLFKLV